MAAAEPTGNCRSCSASSAERNFGPGSTKMRAAEFAGSLRTGCRQTGSAACCSRDLASFKAACPGSFAPSWVRRACSATAIQILRAAVRKWTVRRSWAGILRRTNSAADSSLFGCCLRLSIYRWPSAGSLGTFDTSFEC